VRDSPDVIIHTILAQLSGTAPSAPTAASQPADTAAAIARIRQQWAGNVEAIVAACQGDADAAAQVAPLLDHLAQQDDLRARVAVLRRILAGECDADALLADLDATDALIAGDVLRGLGVAEESEQADEQERQGLTLEQLPDLVAQACRPDVPASLAEHLHGFTRNLSMDADQPAEIQALGRILNAILSGERAPDLSALPAGLAGAVRRMIEGM
jgi:hypothetical protein